MAERLKKLPQAVRAKVLSQCGAGILSLMLSGVAFMIFQDLYLVLPLLLLSAALAGNGLWLFRQMEAGNYMCLRGTCRRVETAGLRKRPCALLFSMELGTVRIPVRQRAKHLAEGDWVAVYVAEKTPVYEKDGIYVIGSYYALEIFGRKKPFD